MTMKCNYIIFFSQNHLSGDNRIYLQLTQKFSEIVHRGYFVCQFFKWFFLFNEERKAKSYGVIRAS